MFLTVRHTFVVLSLGLLLAGCSVNDRAEFGRASSAASVRDIDGHGSSRGRAQPAARSHEQRADVTASEARYRVTLDEFRKLVRDNAAVIIDARGPVDFASGHVRGAFNLPAGEEEAYMPRIRQRVAPDEFIIIYCNGPRCNSSDIVYEYLVPRGFTNMRVFKPGWERIASVRDLR